MGVMLGANTMDIPTLATGKAQRQPPCGPWRDSPAPPQARQSAVLSRQAGRQVWTLPPAPPPLPGPPLRRVFLNHSCEEDWGLVGRAQSSSYYGRLGELPPRGTGRSVSAPPRDVQDEQLSQNSRNREADRHGLGPLRSEGPCVHRPRDVGLGQGDCKREFGSPAPQHTSHAVLPAGHMDSVHCKGPRAYLFPDFTEDPHPESSVTLDGHNDHRSEMEPAVTGLASALSGEGASLLLGGEGAAAPQGGSSCRDMEEARGGLQGEPWPPHPAALL